MESTATAPALGLAQRVALVTGGTRGLGLAIARKLSACGCDVYLTYAKHDDDAERAAEHLAHLPGRVTVLKNDIQQPGSLAEALARVRADHGQLDVFVHNAAAFHPMPTADLDPVGFHADLATALNPLVYGGADLAAALRDGRGRVIAVSSAGAHRVVPRYVSLGVAKAALESMIRYLAADLSHRGIAVNAVTTAKLDKGAGRADPVAAALTAQSPAGRLTTPADVADVVALLCTDEAAWIRGQVIVVDGGLALRP